MRDSCRTSGQVETPKGAKRQEAHRTPCGKRASETESNSFQNTTKQNQPPPYPKQ
ncbi:hypothetical protein [Fictibacillus sp. UD]|uniref:hypothetical protein n=1 Tax=Fictibacillus sp. UD TaxID=3038777 RepID=UPI00374918C4